MVKFIPEPVTTAAPKVPFFEDSQDRKIPGRGTEKSAEKLQAEIRQLMLELDAGNIVFSPGQFEVAPGIPQRHGWLITFSLNGLPGRMEIAALPMRHETPSVKDKALRQALYLVRNWLESEVFSAMYRPGAVPLIPFLIGVGDKTVTEMMLASGELPMLSHSNHS
jgi:hypothetical protein